MRTTALTIAFLLSACVASCSARRSVSPPERPAFVRLAGAPQFETLHLELLGAVEPAVIPTEFTALIEGYSGMHVPDAQRGDLFRTYDDGLPIEERLGLLAYIWDDVVDPVGREHVRLHRIRLLEQRKDVAAIRSILFDGPIGTTRDRADSLAIAARAFAEAGGDPAESRQLLLQGFGILDAHDAAPTPTRQAEHQWLRSLENARIRMLLAAAHVERHAGHLGHVDVLVSTVLARQDEAVVHFRVGEVLEPHAPARAAEAYAAALARSEEDEPRLIDALKRVVSAERFDALVTEARSTRPVRHREALLRSRVDLPLPALRTTRRDGSTLDERALSQSGRVTILTFFSSTCGPCLAEQPALARIRDRHGERVRIVVVGLEQAKDFWPYVDEKRVETFEYSVVASIDKVQRDFHAEGVPVTLILDEKGRIAFRHDGFGPGSARALEREVDVLLTE